jgi:nicotinamide-nucleotide amidase
MKTAVVFAGTKFIYNESLQDYVLRSLKKENIIPHSIEFFKDGDHSLFLEFERMFAYANELVIITSKQNFPTIGKVLCTITEDTLVVKDKDTLIPAKATLYSQRSYLIEQDTTHVNVLCIDEMQKMPKILLRKTTSSAVLHLFEEDETSAKVLLETLSQTYDVKLVLITLVEGWIEVHVESKKHGNIAKFISAAKQLLPKKIIAAANIFIYIIKRLAEENKTVTFAESCTGGLLTYYFTKHNGASAILNGSLVTYANEIKASWLAVDTASLENYGAVSTEVVAQMSLGALSVSGADYALSISGIAGDTGGSEEKPVGTVFIGVRSKEAHKEEHLLFQGDRNYVQHQSCLFAVKMLLLHDKEIFF